jgi:hypothetical protein
MKQEQARMTVMKTHRELRNDELDAVTGGGVSMSYGSITFEYGKQSPATGGDTPTTITIFGVQIPLPPPK